ncbi:MAG: DUF366 family protein [Candidatus Coatesbacteria bacterium]|nr:MAG: DUF366 family protein [Candidatus Coatesbacteria bacterium]
MITTHFDSAERAYTELYGHFARKNFGLAGDAAVAFVGPCEVRGDKLVDLADRAAGNFIVAARMLHFVVEHFGLPLSEAVWRQRVLAALVAEEVARRVPGTAVERRGDDVYAAEGKLTVSIATVSPTSALIHLGVNVDATGAPVVAADLQGLGIDERELAEVILNRYAEEVETYREALGKVDGVC